MLNKEVCKKCNMMYWRKLRGVDWWDKSDERRWKNKKLVWCPQIVKDAITIGSIPINHLPENCPYFLEHLVNKVI